jgi:hypothetical protein
MFFALGVDLGAVRDSNGGGHMNTSRMWIVLSAWVALSGCVHGYGCLFLQPVKHTLTGRVHFRSFPAADGVDNVPILVLDRTAYVYSPAHSYQCMSATDVQLVGVSEFPENVIENSQVSVSGALFESTSAHEYTRFLMNVTTLLPLNAKP